MKIFLVSVALAGMLVGCGSDSDDEKKSPMSTPTDIPSSTSTPTPTDNTQVDGSSSGTSKYLKFDEEFVSERESAGDRYYMVSCEDTGYSYNDVDYGDIASYEYHSNLVNSNNTGTLEVTAKNGELLFGEVFKFKIVGDYGDYALVKVFINNYPPSYQYWYPKPVDADIENAFNGNGNSYMDHKGFKFNHQGRCTPNSLNEHIANWKSLQE